METLLQALRAAGEQTRLRILALCAHHELSVTDVIQILGQTQSRVSRHLKILVEAGLLERHQEGQWARYRVSGQGSALPGQTTNKAGISLARYILQNIDMMNPIFRRDHELLTRRLGARQQRIQQFFTDNATDWEDLRSIDVDRESIDAAIEDLLLNKPIRHLLDVGTGTGTALLKLGPRIGAGIGVDNSFAMLDVARNNIEESNLTNCQVRHADMLQMPYEEETFDAALINMVLHYTDDPAAALSEITRVLAPGGRVLIVDLRPHNHTELRTAQRHVWPGFSNEEIAEWVTSAGIQESETRTLKGTIVDVFATLAEKAPAGASLAA